MVYYAFLKMYEGQEVKDKVNMKFSIIEKND